MASDANADAEETSLGVITTAGGTRDEEATVADVDTPPSACGNGYVDDSSASSLI